MHKITLVILFMIGYNNNIIIILKMRGFTSLFLCKGGYMKNDNKIRTLLEEIGSEISYVLAQPNFDAHTDRYVEEIVDKAKEIEQLHNERFVE